ncbi:hypothetical protein PROFUN_11763 [Planoprotostelium fungivorum]|uniref:Uncharacterized protein n=1 Tax=Planoprotostelium fungivorum TaxID=1890364 RepID=A0A2P6N8L1_9EUKA|nr:hypothetical protein PROFUN_11763 [Planoprotostelium fungivorum]
MDALKDTPVTSSSKITFKDIHKQSIILNNKTPYRRVLGYHAYVAHDIALERDWIRQQDWDNFEIFHNLSEGDLAEREERPAWSQHLDQILLLEKDTTLNLLTTVVYISDNFGSVKVSIEYASRNPSEFNDYHYKQVSKEGDWTRCKGQNQKKDTASC